MQISEAESYVQLKKLLYEENMFRHFGVTSHLQYFGHYKGFLYMKSLIPKGAKSTFYLNQVIPIKIVSR